MLDHQLYFLVLRFRFDLHVAAVFTVVLMFSSYPAGELSILLKVFCIQSVFILFYV